MVVLVTGSRNYKDLARVDAELRRVTEGAGEVILVSGGARGADLLGEVVAKHYGWRIARFDADWDALGTAAGIIRNQRMLDDMAPDVVVAFPLPGSRGTWDMVRRATAASVPTVIVDA